jgi:hypothetical protein
MLPLTPDQRKLIKQNFKNSNVDVKYGGEDSEYVLNFNANVVSGKGRISFRNEDGVLVAAIDHHDTHEDAIDPKVIPTTQYDFTITSEKDMKKLIVDLS